MKIKLFCGNNNNDALEKQVDNFISSVNVIDIKFSSVENSFDTMVIYNELPENENT